MTTQIELDRPVAAEDDSAKRRQIIEGAREVFLAQGFDAASMGEIARAAGVSKGTLYVYFKNKEELFAAIVDQECSVQAEQVFGLDRDNPDLEASLTQCGIAFVKFICREEKASAVRIVMAIADRMPEIGRKFYEHGPAVGITKLAAFLKTKVDDGTLVIEDCEVAAAQLLDSFHSTMSKPVFFNFRGPPTQERIEHVVGIAVRAFLAAYRRRT
jgi:AcrR family transcriptional regulator